MIFWIFPALGASISDAVHNLYIKKQTLRLGALSVSWIRSFWIAILLSPLVFFFPASPTPLFWWILLIRTTLDTVATVLYVNSIKQSDLSVALPLIALSPLFIVIIDFFITGTIPSFAGFFGILLIVLGTYIIHIEKGDKNFFAPFINIYKDNGSRMMLAVSVIWSITSTIHTVAIKQSNPYFYAGVSSIAIIFFLTIFMFFKDGFKSQDFKSSNAIPKNIVPGVLGATAQLFQFIAQSFAPASYVIAIKRTSILFSSLLGGLVLKEDIKARIIPTIIVLLGVFLIVLR